MSSATRRRAMEAAKFAAEIVDNPEYRKNFKARALAGLLAPGVENVLLYYRFGKPVDRLEISDVQPVDLEEMTAEELAERAETIAVAIREMRQQELEEQRAEKLAKAVGNGVSPDTSFIKPEPVTLDSPIETLERVH